MKAEQNIAKIKCRTGSPRNKLRVHCRRSIGNPLNSCFSLSRCLHREQFCCCLQSSSTHESALARTQPSSHHIITSHFRGSACQLGRAGRIQSGALNAALARIVEVEAVPSNQQGIRPVCRVATSCEEKMHFYTKLTAAIGSIGTVSSKTDNGILIIKRAGELKPDK